MLYWGPAGPRSPARTVPYSLAQIRREETRAKGRGPRRRVVDAGETFLLSKENLDPSPNCSLSWVTGVRIT